MTQTLYEFGEFEIDCPRFELRRDARVVKLEHIPWESLILAEKDGSAVTRQAHIGRSSIIDFTVAGQLSSWASPMRSPSGPRM